MIADATLIDRTKVSAMRFYVAMRGIGFGEEGEGEDASLLMGEGSGVSENMVKDRPFTLVFVGAWLQFGSSVDEVMTAGEKFELGSVSLSIEITHDDEVGVPSDGSYRIGMCLQLLTDVHAQFLSFCTPSFRG